VYKHTLAHYAQQTAHGLTAHRPVSLVSDAKLDGMVPFKLLLSSSLLKEGSRRYRRSGEWVKCDEYQTHKAHNTHEIVLFCAVLCILYCMLYCMLYCTLIYYVVQ
jgi:hypothetical protein